MLVMVVFFIAFRWIHLSTPLIRLFLLVLILFLMPTLNFLPVWFALSLLRFFFFKQKTAYEMDGLLEFRRVLFRSRLGRPEGHVQGASHLFVGHVFEKGQG